MTKSIDRNIYHWCQFSDQPMVIRDKGTRRKLYIKGATGRLKTAFACYLIPLIAVNTILIGRTGVKKQPDSANEPVPISSIGLCVNIDCPLPEKVSITTQQLYEMVTELGMQRLLIRVPLSDIENLHKYVDFVHTFRSYDVSVNILQDRRHIEDLTLLRQSLNEIFTRLRYKVCRYQIGNATNRLKWAFTSLDEYFIFFGVAYELKTRHFPELQLLGSSIIDFELPYMVRSLFHRAPIRYDGAAVQLYVDRLGAPENKQLGCDLLAKIRWFSAVVGASPKSHNALWITETNWPLEGTSPFAPAYGSRMVNEDQQAAYLVRYFLLMIASCKVVTCFWHQLIAPGYGLVDNRGESIRKRKAFYCFKLFIALFQNADFIAFNEHKNGMYQLTINNSYGIVDAFWANGQNLLLKVDDQSTVVDITGNTITPTPQNDVRVNDDVIYVFDYLKKP